MEALKDLGAFATLVAAGAAVGYALGAAALGALRPRRQVAAASATRTPAPRA